MDSTHFCLLLGITIEVLKYRIDTTTYCIGPSIADIYGVFLWICDFSIAPIGLPWQDIAQIINILFQAQYLYLYDKKSHFLRTRKNEGLGTLKIPHELIDLFQY
ncbi:hypothetical protein ACJX0J_002880 [Zea mays]